MTPAERARQIDKEEFAAECAANRQRALAYANECRQREWQRVRAVVGSAETMQAPPVRARSGKLYTYGGMALTVDQWAKRLNVSSPTLYARRRKHGSMETAIAMGGKTGPGVVSDFSELLGTSGGRHA